MEWRPVSFHCTISVTKYSQKKIFENPLSKDSKTCLDFHYVQIHWLSDTNLVEICGIQYFFKYTAFSQQKKAQYM